jgi:hypothetical protein
MGSVVIWRVWGKMRTTLLTAFISAAAVNRMVLWAWALCVPELYNIIGAGSRGGMWCPDNLGG